MHVFRAPLLGSHLMPKLNPVRRLFSQGEQHGGKEFARALPTMSMKNDLLADLPPQCTLE